MARDYARQAKAFRRPAPRGNRKPVFVVFLIVIVVLMAGGWFYAKSKVPGTFFSTMKAAFQHKSTKTLALKENPTAEQPTEVHFDFYNQLPSMQVRIAPLSSTVSVSSTQPMYILQFGTFNRLNEASEARISYLLAGADANIVKVSDGYRVQQGPYSDLAVAKAIQKKLHKKGVETTLKKSTA